MIHSGQFQRATTAERLIRLAAAYLDGSIVLCEEIIEDDRYIAEYPYTRVILHLCRHALELFLKGAIARLAGDDYPKHHHLRKLTEQYQTRYPDSSYWLSMPFGIEQTDTLFPELEETYYATLDQRYRYPDDNRGKLFSDPEGFVAGSFLVELQELRRDFLRLRMRFMEEDATPPA